MAQHTVAPGDCFASLAKANGYTSYQPLYNHALNKDLKAKRPNPNQLAEGDVVEIPAIELKTFPVATDERHRFVATFSKTRIKLVLKNAKDEVLKAKACSLEVGDAKQATLPDGSGLLDMEIDATTGSGTLRVTWDPPASTEPEPAAPAPAAADAPPPYPIPIVAADFKDDAAADKPPTEMTWSLRLGTLEPAAVVRGCMRRLNNLGFNAPDVTAEDDATAAAVKAYQRAYKLAQKGSESGLVADIRANLEKRHDNK